MMRTIVTIGAVVLVLAIAADGSPTSKTTGKPENAARYAGGGGNNEGNNGGGNNCGSGSGSGNVEGCVGFGGEELQRLNDVELFFDIRDKLVEVATNAIGFSQLASLNSFNHEAFDFAFIPPGKLSVYVREVEKEPAQSPFNPSGSNPYPAPTYGGSYGGYRPTVHNKPSYGSVSSEE